MENGMAKPGSNDRPPGLWRKRLNSPWVPLVGLPLILAARLPLAPAHAEKPAPSVEASFLNLEPVRFLVPILSLPLLEGGILEETRERIQADIADFQERRKKEWRIVREVWEKDAGLPEGATITVIRDLVETGGLLFEFVADSSGTFQIEVLAPRAPFLGPIQIHVGDSEAGLFDAWSDQAEPSRWRRLPRKVRVTPGRNELRITQKSDLDARILLRAFRVLPDSPLSSSPTP